MIPVQLTIKGLFSYTKSETIDFQTLVNAKLFGIFGPVGSGKSAILEAIMFVLFDRSTRLNKAGDDRYYNMMNLQSNEMIIDFIFKSGPNHKKKYRFYFLARRKTKDFHKVEVRDRSYYQWSKNEWQPLEKPDVLGMTYENFRQTVIIPQGKFSEFIDQKPTARTQMLKELFSLDRFDIAPQAFRLYGAVKDHCNFLEGQLSQYEDINKFLLKQLAKEMKSLNESIEQKSSKEKEVNQAVGGMQVLQHIHNELVEVTEILNTLQSESFFIEQKQHQLDRYIRIQDVFREKIYQQRQILQTAKSKQEELSTLIKVVDQLEATSTKCTKRWEQAQAKYAEMDHLKLQRADLELLVQLKRVQINFDNTFLKWQESEQELQRLEKQVGEIDQFNNRLKKASDQKFKALEDLQRMTHLKAWWATHAEKVEQLQSLEKEESALKEDLNGLADEMRLLKTNIRSSEALKREISESKEDLQSLLIQEHWLAHASLLAEGKPCPLCGATSHPKPLPAAKLSSAISSAHKKLQDLENEFEFQKRLMHQLENLATNKKEKDKTLSNLKNQRATLLKARKKHDSKFPGPGKIGGRPPELNQKINKTIQTIEAAKKEQDTLNNRLRNAEKILARRENEQKTLDHLALTKEKLNGEIAQMSRMIKTLDTSRFLKKEEQQLTELTERVKQKLESIDMNYKTSLGNLSKVDQQLNHQKGLLQSLEIQVADINDQSHKLEKELFGLCKKESIKGLKEVQNILSLNLDVDRERKELDRYHTDLNMQKGRKIALVKKLGKRKYQQSTHHQLVQEWDTLKLELRQLRDQLSSKQHTHRQLEMQLKKKDAVAKELLKASVRKDHIQEISNLLRGNGFINYISSVYLQNLCKVANVRFTKLTSNRLSLELNEQNEFMVRDFLNDGKLRLLKTLSGGQIFQASLCLALGLAENVKSLNQADQSFFFLDEGFGSLDSASLQLVFETLKSLQKENRIVGIISHVEELQAEIDTYLSVQQVEDKGSTISRSWEMAS